MAKAGCIWLVGLVLFLAFSSLALAQQQSTVDVTPADNEIAGSEEASFDLFIKNTAGERRTYTIYGLNVVWSIIPELRRVTLAPGESRTIAVSVRPPREPFQPSTYTLNLYIDSIHPGSSIPLERFKEELSIILFPAEPLDYVPAVRVGIELSDTVNPQEPVPVKVVLENRNPRDLDAVTVRIQSDMPEFQQEAVTELPSFEQRTVEFSIIPSPYQEPKRYYLFVILEFQGETIKVIDRTIDVMALTPLFEVAPQQETVFFRKVVSLEVHNPGNVENTQEVLYPVSGLEALFASSDAAIVRDNGKRYLRWELSLRPAEKNTLQYAINYRAGFYILLLLLLLGLFYLAVRSPIRVLKSAHATHGEEGTLSAIKVLLEVQNKRPKTIKNVQIIDLVPGIANVEKEIEAGTLKPHEFRHTHRGTKVIWNLPELEPHEHRVINYKIKAKLNILGSFSLPRAVVEYSRGKKKRKAYSNTFQLGV